MPKKFNISVVIPSNHSHQALFKIVNAVCCQTIKPSEIVIVDSAREGGICPEEVSRICCTNDIKLNYVHLNHALPGLARNLGINISTSKLIAFVDVQTIPRPYWLQESLRLLFEGDIDGVFGGTQFTANSNFEKLVRDAFYGCNPRKTLPGSVFKRDVILKTGHFIDWVRAGEDTEWMLRLELLKIKFIEPPEALIDYEGLTGVCLNSILRKWHRNYSASHELPHLFPQKIFLRVVLYPLIIFIAFNWNYLFANWYEYSPFYIAHITKMAAILPPLAYVITRGIVLPYRRGVNFWRIFPLRFIKIALICFMADIVKALIFSRVK